MLSTLAQLGEKGWWMPVGGSTFSEDVDWTFFFILWVSVFFFVVIGSAMFWFAWKYRMKEGDENRVSHGAHHNNTLEITWSVIPLLIVLAIFVWGFRGFLDMTTPPGNAYEILVDAKKWSWEFKYPEGVSSPFLHLPAGQPVRFVLNSQDVIHSFYVPAFRTKKDVVPGRYNKIWVQAKWDQDAADELGEVAVTIPGSEEQEVYNNVLVYDLYCAEYCGTRHSQMFTSVIVHTPEGFQAWIEEQKNFLGDPDITPVEKGNRIFLQKGCVVCHTADGSTGTGPTFRNLFGREENLQGGGTVLVDEDYITDSIRYPGRQIVQGFENQMPLVGMDQQEITYLIAWMKSISDDYQATLEQINAEYSPGQADADAADVQERQETDLPPQQLPTREEAREIPSEDVGDQGIEPDDAD